LRAFCMYIALQVLAKVPFVFSMNPLSDLTELTV
jgi:hypothetical protein